VSIVLSAWQWVFGQRFIAYKFEVLFPVILASIVAADFNVFLTDGTGPKMSVHVFLAPLKFASCFVREGRSCFVTVWRLLVEDVQVRGRECAVAVRYVL